MRPVVHGARVLCATLFLLAGCATDQPAGPSDQDLQAFTAGAYRATERSAATSTRHALQAAGQARNAVLTLPETTARVPLVIYLPGLGEAADAGDLWRTAWSAAGYAVLSVQLLAVDEGAWTSALARRGEFRKLGLDRFAAPAARQRLLALAEIVAEGRRLSSQGDPAWSRVDWNRIAVAGYDVGAYTASIAAGETVDGFDDRPSLPIRAVIALSPFANFAKGPLDRRYRDIAPPVLGVTSNIDDDPLGLTDGAAQRGVPFEHMRGPDKILLTLRDVSHARLAGGAAAVTPDPVAQRAEPPRGGDIGTRRGAGQRPNQDERDEPMMEPPRAVERAVVRGLSANALRLRVAVTQAVSTAFLDAHVKDDTRAREWLAKQAQPWIGGLGMLRRK